MQSTTFYRIIFFLLIGFGISSAQAQVCAPPSSLVAGTASGVVNNYYVGNGNLNIGDTSLVLGANDARVPAVTLAVGDLLLVMQMQDASIVTANNNTYGNNSGSGAGSTSVGRSGLFEFVRVTSVGASVGFTPALTNSYTQLAATATNAQKIIYIIFFQTFCVLCTTLY